MGCDAASSASAKEHAAADQSEATAEDGKEAAIPEISVKDAAKALESGAVAVDANSDKTRKDNGTVPGAVILTSSYKYDLAQLPKDKSTDLVFYCSNTKCTASDAAADRAASHGYTNVHIMRAGIKGWKAAGNPTTPY
jgi:rhodanese-related sulfurtransferase